MLNIRTGPAWSALSLDFRLAFGNCVPVETDRGPDVFRKTGRRLKRSTVHCRRAAHGHHPPDTRVYGATDQLPRLGRVLEMHMRVEQHGRIIPRYAAVPTAGMRRGRRPGCHWNLYF